jgi:trigger factor
MNLKQESEYRFRIDVKETLIKKTNMSLPREFLKRWLFEINEGKFTKEQIEKDFDHFAEDLKWQLIKDKISSDNKLEISEEDLKLAAKELPECNFDIMAWPMCLMNILKNSHGVCWNVMRIGTISRTGCRR